MTATDDLYALNDALVEYLAQRGITLDGETLDDLTHKVDAAIVGTLTRPKPAAKPMGGRVNGATIEALRVRFDETFAALRRSGVEYDHPTAIEAHLYREASNALNHASRRREAEGDERTVKALDALENGIQALATGDQDAFTTEGEGIVVMAGSGADHANLLYEFVTALGWWPEPLDRTPRYVEADFIVGMLSGVRTLSARVIAKQIGADLGDTLAVLQRDDRFEQEDADLLAADSEHSLWRLT